jgi:hypothetical protein
VRDRAARLLHMAASPARLRLRRPISHCHLYECSG